MWSPNLPAMLFRQRRGNRAAGAVVLERFQLVRRILYSFTTSKISLGSIANCMKKFSGFWSLYIPPNQFQGVTCTTPGNRPIFSR